MRRTVGLTGLQILDYKRSDCKSNPAALYYISTNPEERGVALSGVDMAVNGVNVSNSLDLVMGGVAFISGFGGLSLDYILWEILVGKHIAAELLVSRFKVILQTQMILINHGKFINNEVV
ncbi:hypothetical protein [uncultured Sunxiuqinia sp.]|uniref:hypothetical protein n=1 Tax=uncultured Sunxiuqinia sp. TaxID=1573825 RepID=UPI002602B8F6|nr:hypothetical protein [uncultured Sunxiuqinia sp.]